MPPIHVAVLAFNGVSLFHLSVPGLVFGALDYVPDAPRYVVRYCAEVPGMVDSDQGIAIAVQSGLELMQESEVIIIPAWSDPSVHASAKLVEALRLADAQGKLIVGLCLGAFVLGDAGLLDDKEATTHWLVRDMFARRFPKARFRPEVLYASADNIVTSAGTLSAIDCCLHLVRQRHGARVANRAAKLLVTPPHRQGGQAQYIEHAVPRLASETHLSDVLAWARRNLASNLSVDVLATRARMSRRTFTRRFAEATGSTVNRWLNSERVARAQELLETTQLSIECIASEAGFGTPLSLRQQFSAQLGTSPSDYRRMFCRHLSSEAGAKKTKRSTGLPESDAFHFRRPADFPVPLEWQGTKCIALPAAPSLVELDYAAVMASREQLQGLFGAGDAWPPADLTQADDEADLAWHEREFVQGASFAYSLLSTDRQRCLGCLYLSLRPARSMMRRRICGLLPRSPSRCVWR